MWETIDQDLPIGSITTRLQVPGGWLVRHVNRNVGGESMAFLADAKHLWDPKETK